MARRLKEKVVARLKRKPNRYYKWDGEAGLGIQIMPTGSRIWVCQLKYPGDDFQTKRTLGYFINDKDAPEPALGNGAGEGAAGPLTLTQARQKAARWYGWVKEGKDPRDEEAALAEKQAESRRLAKVKNASVFDSYAEQYIKDRSDNRRAEIDEREIRRNLIAVWGDRPISKIKPHDVRELVEELKHRAPYEARNCWGHIVGIFKQAVHDELIDVSPCASLSKKLLFRGADIQPRQRVLSDLEVAALWRASDRLGYPYGPFYKLLLLTGVRLEELAAAEWKEFTPEVRRAIRDATKAETKVDWRTVEVRAKLWTVPRGRFKSNAEHRVPLSDDALTIIETIPRMAGSDFLFTTTGKAINGFSVAKKRLDKFMVRALKAVARRNGDDPKATKLARYINHDLRRTVRTNLSALEVPDHVAELVIGHARKGLQRIYDQHRYEPQIREALNEWADRVRAIVSPPLPPRPAFVIKLTAKRKARG